ncbi:hypothetical protein FOMG_16871 [Fusarium oxysporum f. sp. melonis 26406]|uniref:Uncharacterized protein n=1 Tax=Fusarium oxysporum f. sp. melonis 26406 TaxID=1089452 RepID=W9ZZT9_FUSOX|nr:hypothetical protein FOMG_16871 [Fusarium oxysporum f. sp. melonis 26406]
MSSESAMPQATNTADVSMTEDHDYAEGALEEKWVADLGMYYTVYVIVEGNRRKPELTTLWNDFNHAWLGLGQRQIDVMTSSQQLWRTQNLVSEAMIKKMGNELIRLCDGIERHGLVDYQYGVWEDQITAVLGDCLDLYDASEEGSDSGNR